MTDNKLEIHDRIKELKAELADNASFKRAWAIRTEIDELKALLKPDVIKEDKPNILVKIFSWCLTLWLLNYFGFFTWLMSL